MGVQTLGLLPGGSVAHGEDDALGGGSDEVAGCLEAEAVVGAGDDVGLAGAGGGVWATQFDVSGI